MNYKVKLKRKISLDESYKFEEAEKSDLLAKKLEERYVKKYALKHLYSMHNQKIMQFADGCKQMLEIGCGIGNFLIHARTKIEDVYGIDLGSYNARFCYNRLEGKSPIFIADGERLPFIDSVFDCVVMKGVIHHLGSPEKVFSEARRVLNHKGRIIIFEGDPSSMYRKIILSIADMLQIEHECTLFQHLTPAEISNLLSKNDFVNIQKKGVSGLFAPIGLSAIGGRRIWQLFDKVEESMERKLNNPFRWYNIITAETHKI